MSVRWLPLLAAVAMVPSSSALADIASQTDTLPCTALHGPTSLRLRDSGFDRNRSACTPARTLSVGLRPTILIDAEKFYGTLNASLFLEYRTAGRSGYEFGLMLRAVDHRFAQTAVFATSETNAGPLALSIARPTKRSLFGNTATFTHSLLIALPLTDLQQWRQRQVQLAPSLLVSTALSEAVHLHMRAAALLENRATDLGPESRAALLASTDVSLLPVTWGALLLGVEAQGGWHGLGLDHLQARAGMRMGGEHSLELSAGINLAGRERSDATLWLGYQHVIAEKKEKKRSRLKDWAH